MNKPTEPKLTFDDYDFDMSCGVISINEGGSQKIAKYVAQREAAAKAEGIKEGMEMERLRRGAESLLREGGE